MAMKSVISGNFPLGQIALGIYGHAGTAIDQLGMVCDSWNWTRLSAAFVVWMRANGIQNATIADETHSAGLAIARRTYLSHRVSNKGHHATCVATLVESGKLSYTDTLDKRFRTS